MSNPIERVVPIPAASNGAAAPGEVVVPPEELHAGGFDPFNAGVNVEFTSGPISGGFANDIPADLADRPPGILPAGNARVAKLLGGKLSPLWISAGSGASAVSTGGITKTQGELRLTLFANPKASWSGIEDGRVHFTTYRHPGKPYAEVELLGRVGAGGQTSWYLDGRAVTAFGFARQSYDARYLPDGKSLAVGSAKHSVDLRAGSIGVRSERDADGLGGSLHGATFEPLSVEAAVRLLSGPVPIWISADVRAGTIGVGYSQLAGEDAGMFFAPYRGTLGLETNVAGTSYKLSAGTELVQSGQETGPKVERRTHSARFDAGRRMLGGEGKLYVEGRYSSTEARDADLPSSISADSLRLSGGLEYAR